MAANFGWDWGPRLLTAGIWRAVHLERWQAARLDVFVRTPRVPTAVPHPGERGDVIVDVELAVAPRAADRSAAGRPAGARPGGQPRRPRGGHAGRRVVAGNRDGRGGRRPTLVPDRARRAAAVRRQRVVGSATASRSTGRPVGWASVTSCSTRPPMATVLRSPSSSTAGGLDPWLQLDPRRLLSRPGDAAATRRPHRRCGRGQRQPAARVGRRRLRVRRLLRRVRPPWRARVAGLRLRLRGVPRGAARRRGARRGHRQRRSAASPTRACSCGAPTTRTCGASPTGAGPSSSPGGRGARASTARCSPRCSPSRDPGRPYLDGTPTSLDPAIHPNDARSRHGPPVGRLERRGLRSLPHARAAVRRRVRLPGAGDAARRSAVRSPAARSPSTIRGWRTTRKRPTVTPSWIGG